MKYKINSRHFLLCLGLSTAVVTALTGCNNNNNPPANPPNQTAGQAVDDQTLTAHVKAALIANPDYKLSEVTVSTMTGTVQLSGFVNTEDLKSKAVEIAKGVQGVKDVQDKIAVKPQ